MIGNLLKYITQGLPNLLRAGFRVRAIGWLRIA